MSTKKKLEQVSARTYRICSSEIDGTQSASRFAPRMNLPDAAKAATPSRFANWVTKHGDKDEAEAVSPLTSRL